MPRRFRAMPGRGFTLVELLVAITILAVVAVLGWRGLDGIVRARIALTENLERTRGMQLTFAQLQSDCARLAEADRLRAVRPLTIDGARLVLVRNVFADDQPSRVQVVVYRLQDGVLTRRESLPTRDLTELARLWRIARDDTDASRQVTLQTGVAAMTLRVWIGDGWHEAGAGSVASGASGNPLQASGLEVSLQSAGTGAGIRKIFLLGAA